MDDLEGGGIEAQGAVDGVAGCFAGMRMVGARRFGAGEMRLHAEWAEAVRELLTAAGWGEGRVEDSVEFQVRRKWESALDELATLDFDGVTGGVCSGAGGVGADCAGDYVCAGVGGCSGTGDGAAGGCGGEVRRGVVFAGGGFVLAGGGWG